MTTQKYKGIHFGQLKSLRTQFQGRKGPGPGDYDPHVKQPPSNPPPAGVGRDRRPHTEPNVRAYLEEHRNRHIWAPELYNTVILFT